MYPTRGTPARLPSFVADGPRAMADSLRVMADGLGVIVDSPRAMADSPRSGRAASGRGQDFSWYHTTR